MGSPRLIHALAEPVRAAGEYATSTGLMPFVSMLPAGDGHPVIVLPGFTAGDRSTGRIRRVLAELGYRTEPWQLGRNLGPTRHVVEGLPRLLEATVDDAGEAASIVGWSLGGVFARDMAARRPHLVRQVVTLGSPVREDDRYPSRVSKLFEALAPVHVPERRYLDGGRPLPVPVTAMHTRSDGVVHWQTCLVQAAPNAENLRVRGSHSGLGFNPAVIAVLADRLALPAGQWRPFDPPVPYRRVVTRVPFA